MILEGKNLKKTNPEIAFEILLHSLQVCGRNHSSTDSTERGAFRSVRKGMVESEL